MGRVGAARSTSRANRLQGRAGRANLQYRRPKRRSPVKRAGLFYTPVLRGTKASRKPTRKSLQMDLLIGSFL
jgi:hypothetical protein